VALSDHIRLEGVEVAARHGVLACERAAPQPFVIDVALWADCEAAAEADDLDLAVDYAAVHAAVVAAAGDPPCRLIETVAVRVCRAVLGCCRAERVAVTVRKVHPPIAGFAGSAAVTLERDRQWLEAGQDPA